MIKILLALTITICIPAIASQSSMLSIVSNNEVDNCIQKFGDNSDECLENLSDNSDTELQKRYEDKLKKLKETDYTSWWMGNKEQYDSLIENFKASQRDWQKYKIEYCKSATVAEQNTHASAAVMASCLINMNKRRMQEIALMSEPTTK